MESQNLRKYFLSGTLGLCIFGLIASVLSALWLILKFSFDIGFVKIYLIEVILLLAGPILLLSTLKNTIKTYFLLAKLKRNNSVSDVYRSFSNTIGNISFNDNEVIVSDNYLFIKGEVAVIPYQQLKKVYIKYLKNDKKEITGIQLYCDTTKKKKIKIFPNIKNKNELVYFIENIKQRNSSIIFEL